MPISIYSFRNGFSDSNTRKTIRKNSTHRGCGDYASDQTFSEISSLLKGTIREVFSIPCSPIYLGWGPIVELRNKPFPFHAWEHKWPYAYEVYDWQKAHGFYLHENPRKDYSFTTYPKFLELAFVLRSDVRFYSIDVYKQEMKLYESTLSRVEKMKKEGEDRNIEFSEDGQLELHDGWSSASKSINTFCRDLQDEIATLKKNLGDRHEKYEGNAEVVEETIRLIDDKFRQMFVWCLEHHQPEGIAFKGAIEEFLGENYYKAINKIRWLIEVAEKHHAQETLLSKLYLLQGQMQSEHGLYAEAIIELTTAIQKDPQLKEAYFERAAAYFELGQFDKAMRDYLTSYGA